MNYRYFVGIDISKSWFDVAVFDRTRHKRKSRLPTKQFDNDEKGFKSFKSYLATKLNIRDFDSVFICLEHNDLYSIGICQYFEVQKFKYTLVAGVVIANSLGIKRGKNDMLDAKRIALFAFINRDELPNHTLPSDTIRKLKVLNAYRRRLKKCIHANQVAMQEQKAMDGEGMDKFLESSKRVIEQMEKEVKGIEADIVSIIEAEPQLKKNYELTQSVPGIGAVIAAYIIIYTENFTRFNNARQFASYCGIAPYEHQSGSSIRGKTKISSFGYKRLKSLLFMGAMSASKNCPELHLYYKRKLKSGKKPMNVFNAIKNKMIHRVFAVIRRQSLYMSLDTYHTIKKQVNKKL